MLPQLAFEAAITDFVGPLCDDDAHQHAALLLVKSQISGLLARSTIRIGDAVHIVETAYKVQVDVAVILDETEVPIRRSHTLLPAIVGALEIDCKNDLAAPHSEP